MAGAPSIAQSLAALPELERRCLAVMAAVGTPLGRTALAEHLSTASVRHPPSAPATRHARTSPLGRALSSADLAPVIARWVQRGLAIACADMPGEQYTCAPEATDAALSDPACREALHALRTAWAPPPDGPPHSAYAYRPGVAERAVCLARLSLYLGDQVGADEHLARARQAYALRGYGWHHDEADVLLHLLHPRSSAAALSRMSPGLRRSYLEHLAVACFGSVGAPSHSMLDEMLAAPATDGSSITASAVMLAALADREVDAEALLAGDDSTLARQARALSALWRGDFAAARALSMQVVAHPIGKRGRKGPPLVGPLSPLLLLALATGDPEHIACAREVYTKLASRRDAAPALGSLGLLLRMPPPQHARFEPGLSEFLEQLCAALVYVFHDEPIGDAGRRQLERTGTAMEGAGLYWLAAQMHTAVRALRAGPKPPNEPSRARGASLLALHRVEEPWERALSQLESLQPPATSRPDAASPGKTAPQQRLVFAIQLHDEYGGADEIDEFELQQLAALEDEIERTAEFGDREPLVRTARRHRERIAGAGAERGKRSGPEPARPKLLSIEPRLQVRRGQGYTAGRAVALRALVTKDAEAEYLTPEDKRVLGRIIVQRAWYGNEAVFSSLAPLALIGHPRVYWRDALDGSPVPVLAQPPVLRVVQRKGRGSSLHVEPPANSAGIGLQVDREGRLLVSELSPAHVNVQRAVLELPPIPRQGEARLRRILGRMGTLFAIESQVGVEDAAGALEQTEADARPFIQLTRADAGLRARVSVAPLGISGPTFGAGEGLATVVAEVEGRRVRAERDLKAERAQLAALLQAIPALQAAQGALPLELDALEPCLSLLEALRALGEAVVVTWSGEQTLSLVGAAELSSLRLTLGERGEWLQATGTLQIDEDTVLSLLRVLSQRTPDGRFLALGDGRYLSLSQELAAQLGALDAATTGTTRGKRGESIELSPLALGFVSPWLRTLRAAGGLTLDARTARQLERIERAYAVTPELPRTLECELRAYQVSGFEFLSRVAQVGAGACLADDMGLGKTVMTLALLLERGALGPALVVTPTSVRANWFDEALRFAPALRLRRLEGTDAAALGALQAFDVLACSYTVMTQRIEQLEGVRFATVVLDETQAIKNPGTQRARAARRLVADARVALTGTPVENHLGDLYGIMSFLNPGLLGDARHFDARFAKPIQREGDARAREHLRRLIAPFVLRRRKSEVLRELPPRTEITLRVDPDPAEQAFTEALRRAALARLSGKDAAGSTISILAEITRLRRAACHPKLVDGGTALGSAKLERLIELLHELRAGGHRALVFSQFVDFLSIVRDRLTTEGFRYQYLDGSTSESQRKKSVVAFQAGEGDLFLISLKAGGFGLNLTAADYVIHLDPWWNPAVEAQASDRAHRIGQERPVTVYRLVNAATIEERVLSLHARKQALAEELLRDHAEATRLDPALLLSLLQDDPPAPTGRRAAEATALD
jgi:hypothetical protein